MSMDKVSPRSCAVLIRSARPWRCANTASARSAWDVSAASRDEMSRPSLLSEAIAFMTLLSLETRSPNCLNAASCSVVIVLSTFCSSLRMPDW